ncbi:MAG TPA: phosphoribosyltransferase [Desulfotomaculum sp.]|nr:MAG: phosphoribosyltransferase [Peptococcaceae bacterium BRH_c8a]KJS70973.1 MAG: phosphoribosyltransferase [Desulfotomaculum sp. BICA1-6]HBX23896.1 phosphoribosyltransferase [Desulfotomaculum sp.]
MQLYKDRREAGKRLVEELVKYNVQDALVLGIPRGGVVVAAGVAEKLGFPLDIIIPRKVGAPFNPEVAVGAVTQDGAVFLNHMVMDVYNISREEISGLVNEQVDEIKRRMIKYRGSDDYPYHKGKTILLVDDGIATGFTVKAAIASIKNIFSPKKIILAVPVAPPDMVKTLAEEVDEILCPLVPDNFYAVGQFYDHFEQTGDEEVKELLASNRKNMRRYETERDAMEMTQPI